MVYSYLLAILIRVHVYMHTHACLLQWAIVIHPHELEELSFRLYRCSRDMLDSLQT